MAQSTQKRTITPAEFEQYARENNVDVIYPTTYAPQLKGRAERQRIVEAQKEQYRSIARSEIRTVLDLPGQEQREFLRGIALAFKGVGSFPPGFTDLVDQFEGTNRNILHLVADQLCGDAAFTLFISFVGAYPEFFLQLLDQDEG